MTIRCKDRLGWKDYKKLVNQLVKEPRRCPSARPDLQFPSTRAAGRVRSRVRRGVFPIV